MGRSTWPSAWRPSALEMERRECNCDAHLGHSQFSTIDAHRCSAVTHRMLVPGSHKANIAIRDVPELRPSDSGSMDGVLGAVPQYMDPGDVLLFVDCVTHGGERKTTPGVRRSIWYRYTMAWSRLRYGYKPSHELCERLTPQRAAIVDPHYARMLERYPQVDAYSARFEEGGAWSANFLTKEIRDQQVQIHNETMAKAKITLEKKERASTLTEDEAKRLANIRDQEKNFDPTSH
eukprot:COSAG02_NODE_2753_length_8093_cov_4.161746_2_plen_234_part_00